MPYAISTDRPAEDAPFDQHTEPLQWAQWAKDHAPFESVSTKVWKLFVASLPQSYAFLTRNSALSRDQAKRLLAFKPPAKIVPVLEWAVAHNYGVTISTE